MICLERLEHLSHLEHLTGKIKFKGQILLSRISLGENIQKSSLFPLNYS